MAALSAQTLDADGTAVTLAAAAGGGDTFNNDGGQAIFVVFNGGGSPITVTFDSRVTPGPGEAQQDRAQAVAAGERRYFTKIENAFSDDDGTVHVSYSGVTSVTVGVLDPT